MSNTIALGCDHAGFALKESLKTFLDKHEIPYRDFGCMSENGVDYPDFARDVAQSIQRGDCLQGILCCGSGVGICITANRFKGIRAVVTHDLMTAIMSRRHNDANVICFGARVIAPAYAEELLEIFLNTPFDGGRHKKRVDKIDAVSQGETAAC